MQWLVQEREFADATISKSIGLLNGIQWLLRTGRTDPEQPAFSDVEVAGMLELVKEQLGLALPAEQES
ncbi:hypothetical protein QTI33_32160 [Variovorax sp. J22P271]|uniref:hypothetical protein n=1 Tax=Variovorax davisae TaxID=3053515 RepID=UPI0025787FD4|nr:hypothetical protein [Variovorax sp. J22P271]MDM0036828.1 hypothetical protein [Variovorax sp. J22P271]